jgi:gluconolactonase
MPTDNPIPAAAELERVFTGCAFAEGPAADAAGNVFFSDCPNNRIEQDGSLARVIDDMETPNGILIGADGRTLYLVDNNPDPGGARTLLAYTIDSEGRCARTRLLHDFGGGRGGDGMVLDIKGNIYLTAGEGAAAGVYIFAPDGEQIGLIAMHETPGNCTFGGLDLRTLYVASSSSLYRIRLAIPGLVAYPKVSV